MADGDPLARHGGGGGAAGEKRARAAAFADGATAAAAAAAAEADGLLLLLDGLTPSPAKKINRSSGDLLDATGEDGKVLPELLSDHGGNGVTSTWPKPSARKQVLTFGFSWDWDNKSDVDFLNTNTNRQNPATDALRDTAPGGSASGSAGNAAAPKGKGRAGSSSSSSSSSRNGGGGGGGHRRHSDPPIRTAADPTASGYGCGAHGHFLLPTGVARPRRPQSTGSNTAPYSSSSSSYVRTGAVLSNARRGVGVGPARGGAVAGPAQAPAATALGMRANDVITGTGMDMGMAMGMGMGGKETETEKSGAKMVAKAKSAAEMDADALLLPPVDVRDMRLAPTMTSSPAGSVESDFWLADGDGDGDGDENDGVDPMQATHAAIDRLMASTASAAAVSGSHGAARAAAGGGDGDNGGRDAALLEELLLDGLGLQKAKAARAKGNGAAGGGSTKSWRKAKGSADDPGVPTTPANGGGSGIMHRDGMARKKHSSSGGGGSNSSGNRCKKVKVNGGPSPAPSSSSASSASSTPLSTLSSNGRSGSIGGSSTASTPRSAGGLSNVSPGSSISIASMTLAPSLWKLVERGEMCPFPDCAFTVAFAEQKELAKKNTAAKDSSMLMPSTPPDTGAEGDGEGQEGALLEIEIDNLGGAGRRNSNSGHGGDGGGDAHVIVGLGGGVGGVGMLKDDGGIRGRDTSVQQEADAENTAGGGGGGGGGNTSRSRCRHFHTLCGCRHTRGALKGRLFQTNQLDKARNHQKKHAHADALSLAAASSPAVGGPGSAAETPSPMPMPLRSSQESTGSFAWGGSSSQPDAVFSQGTTPSQKRTETGTPVPWSQGSSVSSVGKRGGAVDDDCEDIVVDNDDGTGGFLDDTEDESGMESSAGKSRSRNRAGNGKGGRGTSPGKRGVGDLDGSFERSGTLDAGGGGSGGGGSGSAGAGGLNSRDGRRTWTDAESDRLREVVEHSNAGESRKNWQWVAAKVCEVSGAGRKTPSQCKMRWERILNPGVKRGLWTKEEDQKLKEVAAAMDYKWSHVAKVMGGRTYKQCRERYTNYLKEGLNVGPWSKEEDRLLLTMHAKIGNKWAEIARHLKDRSENMIKNEYMKLSRDASHRRLKSDQDVVDGNGNGNGGVPGTGVDEDGKKSKKRSAKRKPGTAVTVTEPFPAATVLGEGSAAAPAASAAELASHLATTVDVGEGSGVGPRAVLHQQQQQQLGHGHGWQGTQPLDDRALARGDGGYASGHRTAVSSAVTAMAMASATALDSLNLLVPGTTPSNGNDGAGVPIAQGVSAAYADGRVPVAAAADRATYPAGVGVDEAGGGVGGRPNPNPDPQAAGTAGGGDLATHDGVS